MNNTPVCYHFSQYPCSKHSNYFFQYVFNRKLSDICHSHDFYEIIYIINGCCEKMINDKKVSMKSGDLLFLRPSETHVFLNYTPDIKVMSLSVEKNEFETAVDFFDQDMKEQILSFPNMIMFESDMIVNANHILIHQNESNCKLLLCSFINMYIQCFDVQKNIPQIILYAMSEMMKPENIKEGSSAFIRLTKYSPAQLTRIMRKYYDQSINDYIIKIRMKKAYNDISFTNIPLEEICESVGYSSFSHFNKLFKKKFNISPAKLRKKYGLWTT